MHLVNCDLRSASILRALCRVESSVLHGTLRAPWPYPLGRGAAEAQQLIHEVLIRCSPAAEKAVKKMLECM